jgi:hypothetical protein
MQHRQSLVAAWCALIIIRKVGGFLLCCHRRYGIQECLMSSIRFTPLSVRPTT